VMLREYEAAGALVAVDTSSMDACASSLRLLRERLKSVCDRARSALRLQGSGRKQAMLEAEKLLAAVLHVRCPSSVSAWVITVCLQLQVWIKNECFVICRPTCCTRRLYLRGLLLCQAWRMMWMWLCFLPRTSPCCAQSTTTCERCEALSSVVFNDGRVQPPSLQQLPA
jgi:hypothetical protein